MKGFVRSFSACLSLFILLSSLPATKAFGQDNKRVVLQAFWWDFKNNNYPQGWANYLADLAPRLRAMGIDAVWVPVNVKNANPMSVGYSPFDHYDLGDKYQKNNLKTPFGDKDEFLRMVAVMHANGIEVMQDVVLNHMDGAGSATGQGAIDPAYTAFFNNLPGDPRDPTNGYKHFRYASYATPVGDESLNDYVNRRGRWPKNWQNFFPNPSDNRLTGDDGTGISFGPDMAYNDQSVGQSSLGGYNPVQPQRYMRDQGRAWMQWMKKQTGIDGYRFDAVKHFPAYVAEDFLWNMQNNAGFASGGSNMLAVGEWVGGKSEIDNWTSAVQERAGTFDFSLHGFDNTPGLVAMVYGNGSYNIGNLPGQQQDRRFRTVPFVNNHDTFRPNLNSSGNYTGWGAGLAPRIDPREPRLAAAYAVIMAVDGNPQIFFEDLFDIGTLGNRYNHLPNDTSALPVRSDIRNLVMCHNKLGFKQGAYRVPHQSADYLIIERAGKAIIGITDNWANWQAQTIQTSFAPGTRLIDYGNSSPTTDVRIVGQDGRVQISTPPCNGTARRRGYSVWAPEGVNINAPIGQTPDPTSQEWEMEDDLGDSHGRSLQQGGRLPAGSMAARIVGKIYPRLGNATLEMFTSDSTLPVRLILADACGRGIDSAEGQGRTLRLEKNITAQGWYHIMVRNASAANAGQKVWVKATYTAPPTIDAKGTPSFIPVTLDLGADRGVCTGTSLSGFTGAGFTYAWKDSAGTVLGTGNSFRVERSGLFILTKTSTASGCSITDSVRITQVYPRPALPVVRQSGDSLLIDPQPGATYQWLRGGNPVAGATQPYLLPTTNGQYSVRVTSGQGCEQVSAFYNFIVSIRQRARFQLGIRPNPARDHAVWSAQGIGGYKASYRLVDLSGKALLSGTAEVRNGQAEASLPLSGLAAGVYRLEVQADAGVMSLPLVVE